MTDSRRNPIETAHLVVGVLFAIVFLATGQYMRARFPELHGGDAMTRMMYRSAHIYILLSSLVNIAIGAHQHRTQIGRRRRARLVFSAMILLAPVIFTAAFFIEPAPDRLHRPLSQAGAAATAIGTLGYGLLAILDRRSAR